MEYIFKLSEEEAQTVLEALVNEPYAKVVKVINNIQKQAIEQKEKQNSDADYPTR